MLILGNGEIMDLFTMGLEDGMNEPHMFDNYFIQYNEYIDGFNFGVSSFSKKYAENQCKDNKYVSDKT